MACETQRYRDSTRRVGHTTTRLKLGYGVHCGEKLSLKLEPWCQMFCRGTPCGRPFSEWRAKTFLRISTCQFACFQHIQTNLYQAKLRLAFTQKIKGINTANPKLFTDIWYFHFFVVSLTRLSWVTTTAPVTMALAINQGSALARN